MEKAKDYKELKITLIVILTLTLIFGLLHLIFYIIDTQISEGMSVYDYIRACGYNDIQIDELTARSADGIDKIQIVNSIDPSLYSSFEKGHCYNFNFKVLNYTFPLEYIRQVDETFAYTVVKAGLECYIALPFVRYSENEAAYTWEMPYSFFYFVKTKNAMTCDEFEEVMSLAAKDDNRLMLESIEKYYRKKCGYDFWIYESESKRSVHIVLSDGVAILNINSENQCVGYRIVQDDFSNYDYKAIYDELCEVN